MKSWSKSILSLASGALAASLALAGCEKPAEKAPPEAVTAEAAPSAATPTPAAKPASPLPAAAQTYKIRITPGEAEAGKQATSVIEVTPMPGYKMNKEFPSRLAIEPTEGATLAKSAFEVGDAQLSEEMLRFEIPFTAAEAGKLDLAGSTDFSVCNENACKLIRDEKLAWQVAVR